MFSTEPVAHRQYKQAAPLTVEGDVEGEWDPDRLEQVASNRRVLGPDGKVKYVRYSSTKDEKIRAEPEGIIDPFVHLLSFWDEDKPIATLSYYATHPQSYYGQGGVSCDFPGLARGLRDKEQADVFHVHFDGAGGNVSAGKYNDGSPENRPLLARRLADGMKQAFEATKKYPIKGPEVGWRVKPEMLGNGAGSGSYPARMNRPFRLKSSSSRVTASVSMISPTSACTSRW